MQKLSLSSVDFARWLLITMLIGLMFSPPVVNLAQALFVLTLAFSRELRSRVIAAGREPMVLWLLGFYLAISAGVLYSIAPQEDAMHMWGSWRKVLLLPLAVAVFDDPAWKRRLLETFVAVSVISAVVSYVGWLAHFTFPVPGGSEFGVLLRNHATQGMVFAVAAFAALALAFFDQEAGKTKRTMLVMGALLLLGNVIWVLTGRSGYIVTLVCLLSASVALFARSRKDQRPRALVAIGAALALIVAAMALSPTAHQRIRQAFEEANHYQSMTEETSMGIRVVFWKNTLRMLESHPLLGYGTGAFKAAYEKQIAGQSGVAATVTADPHNQFMKIVGENGILGLVVFLGFLVAAYRQRVSQPYRLLGLGVLSAWIVTSMANSHFSTFAEGNFIYLWLGVMLAKEFSGPVAASKVSSL